MSTAHRQVRGPPPDKNALARQAGRLRGLSCTPDRQELISENSNGRLLPGQGTLAGAQARHRRPGSLDDIVKAALVLMQAEHKMTA